MADTSLIFDRTSADVAQASQIRAETLQQGIVPTSSQYDVLNKGSITIYTLNRIEGKQQELMNGLQENGYWNNTIVNKVWTTNDIFRQEDLQRIVNNLAKLVNSYYVYVTTPAVPQPILYWQNLNSIEKILYDIDLILDYMISHFRLCGTFNCGE